jgi:hypothetical protein
MTWRGGAGVGGEVGEAGDATDMTRGRQSDIGDDSGTSSAAARSRRLWQEIEGIAPPPAYLGCVRGALGHVREENRGEGGVESA